jgi:mono/diheme cytochrome c family protein
MRKTPTQTQLRVKELVYMKSVLTRRFGLLLALIALSSELGCKDNSKAVSKFEPNYLYAQTLSIAEDTSLDQPLSDSQDLVSEWFGTLDDPKLPPLFKESDYQDFISLDNLKIAAGPPGSATEPGETGIYRHQCASCHGDSGQGRGLVAASQNPYPRDFRQGLFKYKSTPRRYKPTKSNIEDSLRRGLSGSQMRSFDKLSKKQIDALVDYVIFLSIRGEFERKLLYNAAYELDLEKDRLYVASFKNSVDSDSKKKFESQIETATEILTEVVDMWIESAESEEEIELPKFPLVGSESDENRSQLQESIAKGKKLFVSEEAACAKCHGESAKGDGPQLPDYDDWTKDWTSKIGINPTNIDKLTPLMAMGGMKPQPLKPRNIVEGKFRGGRDPKSLYRRIKYGIVGAPMPAATIVTSRDEKGLQEEDVWHLVNYILSIAEPDIPVPDK